ncbi:MAG: hypothetical protein HOY69_25380 [Streptomyces sp.]|nr:hypothetical protein [Streptomyces sp.]
MTGRAAAGVAKLVAEVLGFLVTIVTLVAWVSGKGSLPDLIGSHGSHPQQSAAASPPLKAAAPAKSAASPSKVPDPLSIALTISPDTRVGVDRYKDSVSWNWVVKLNGKRLTRESDCTIRSSFVLADDKNWGDSPAHYGCDIVGENWGLAASTDLPAGVYTITIDVTAKQGYKASVTHKITLVK